MNRLQNTSNIINHLQYYSGASRFFSKFGDAWNAVKGQVLKLETRQYYREPGNPSFEALEAGDFYKALQILPEARSEDVDLYQSLSRRNVDFIRCRPIVKPITDYLRWELECYRFNASYGERIYFLERSSIFDELALHDFMVFDRCMAFVHDYDETGEIRGGWMTTEKSDIDTLLMLFSIIKADAVCYLNYPLE
ncbi:DUF6879 family protein [Scytonema millei]|uniref:DUF6879 domain-containing protein n=1 Tax=Scytonema millei VB511283 TaxID=1245923 RepID=A0A9X5E1C1_9CYAN|nr:DUF6879 family protein [Scytonema millei]NHC33591.1 hypothetical protein [Scytonema millei VB511283]